MSRFASVLLAIAVCLSAVAVGGAMTAPSSNTYLAVTDVTISPTPPSPDEEFTVVAALHNLGNSTTNYQIDRVELRGGASENFTLHDDASPIGIVRPGKRKFVRLTGTIDDPGTYSLRIHVYGENDEGERVETQYTTEVRVGAERPQLALTTTDAIANGDTGVNVTVANGLPSDARNLHLDVEGPDVTVENPRRIRSLLASGSEETYGFTVLAPTPGAHRITATLKYTASNGTRQTVRQHTQVEFAPLSKRVSLDAKSAAEGSAVSAKVTNFGNVPIENVVVRGESPNATLADTPIDRLDPGESRTVKLNITRFEADGDIPVNVTATYDAGDVRGQADTAVQIASNPGAIRLTGIETETEDGKVHLSGSASNVGLTDADSVIVSVIPSDSIQPAHPNKEYFVGTIPASDFSSFDVFARLDKNVSTVPLKVTYLVDGERRTYTVDVGYEADDGSIGTANQSDTDPILPVAIGGAVTLAVGGLMAFAWRNSRDGT